MSRNTTIGPCSETMPQAARTRYIDFMAHQHVADENSIQIDSYKADIITLTPAHRQALHELTVSVFWPHRARDLDVFLALGRGYLAIDGIGRPLGSAMYFPVGEDYAMFGMMITTPRLQSYGAGARLLRRIMRDCEGRDLRLSATRAAYRLYEYAGFVPVGTIWQHQGIVRPMRPPTAVPGLEVRPLEPADLAQIHALDSHAYGADRHAMLEMFVRLSDGMVALREGRVVGYALKRDFGKGVVIGPLVAENDRIAMQLATPLLQALEGQFARLDTPVESEQFAAFLASAGLGVFDTVTEMRNGVMRRPQDGLQIYGLSAHSLG
ncbi:GNAT family N-acetyltransferase [Thioclava sp. GXIMD4215]|uniref:GNAT family N-acetyltransferase n=1 Tax=Thioclava sp. GXIMD4215 TaxID=3131928 RepID=UPI00324E06FA